MFFIRSRFCLPNWHQQQNFFKPSFSQAARCYSTNSTLKNVFGAPDEQTTTPEDEKWESIVTNFKKFSKPSLFNLREVDDVQLKEELAQLRKKIDQNHARQERFYSSIGGELSHIITRLEKLVGKA